MSTLLRSRCLWGLGLACLGLTLLVESGCSSRPENSPVVRKKFQELAAIQEQVGDLAIKVNQMTKTMEDVNKAFSTADGASKIEQIDTRLQTLEQDIKSLNESLGAKARTVASADTAAAQPADKTEAAAEKTEPAEAKPAASAPAKSSTTIKTSKAVASSSTPTRKAIQSTPPKPRGSYYSIKFGDSPASIARRSSSSCPRAVRITMWMPRVDGSDLRRRQTSSPVSPGIMISRNIRSGLSRSAVERAVSPSSAIRLE